MNFWEKPLNTLTQPEWEKLCDGCGRCCMQKFEDEDTGEILHTHIACRLFDANRCACSDYSHRLLRVPECLNMRHFEAEHFQWLPKTCAYRLRFEGKALLAWHPLLSGSQEQMHELGISMRNKSISEDDVDEEQWVDYIIDVTDVDEK
ncbi:MAG: YcgN family cysteine cluster protein [Mariprofundaceae bacterium]|nr:YcgN family cysteine cluster protein [Mariprofundaceae bacterium]